MKNSRRLTALLAALVLTFVTAAPASAAPSFGPSLPPFGPTYDISFPPHPIGELTCTNGILIGNFGDLDQDPATLRVYGITANDFPAVEYPAYRAWGTFIVYVPGHRNQVNLVAYDADGNRTYHRSAHMRADGSCYAA